MCSQARTEATACAQRRRWGKDRGGHRVLQIRSRGRWLTGKRDTQTSGNHDLGTRSKRDTGGQLEGCQRPPPHLRVRESDAASFSVHLTTKDSICKKNKSALLHF